MKNTRKLETFLLALLISSIPSIIYWQYCENKVEVGQVWKYSTTGENPYKKPLFSYHEIIGVKDGYVLFIKNKKDTISQEKSWFLLGSKIVK